MRTVQYDLYPERRRYVVEQGFVPNANLWAFSAILQCRLRTTLCGESNVFFVAAPTPSGSQGCRNVENASDLELERMRTECPLPAVFNKAFVVARGEVPHELPEIQVQTAPVFRLGSTRPHPAP